MTEIPPAPRSRQRLRSALIAAGVLALAAAAVLWSAWWGWAADRLDEEGGLDVQTAGASRRSVDVGAAGGDDPHRAARVQAARPADSTGTPATGPMPGQAASLPGPGSVATAVVDASAVDRLVGEPTAPCAIRGLVVEGHQPRANVEVRLISEPYDNVPFFVAETSASDGQGRFEFADLKPSRYSVEAIEPGFIPHKVVNLDCADGDQHDAVLKLGKAGTHVSGMVVDASGKPIPDARVIIICREPAPYYSVVPVDGAGRFETWIGPDMRCQLQANARGFDYAGVDLGGRNTEERVKIELRQATKLGGLVVDDTGPVAGAMVLVRLLGGDREVRYGEVSDASGRFAVPITEGEVQACATTRNRYGVQDLRVTSAETRADLLIRLGPARRVSGIVKRADGKPQPAVGVQYSCRDVCCTGSMQTDLAGRFVFENVPPGRAAWFRVLDEVAAKSERVEVAADQASVELLFVPKN